MTTDPALARATPFASLRDALAARATVHPDGLTIGVVSDLHVEGGVRLAHAPCPEVDVLVAAGDISTQAAAVSSVRWLQRYVPEHIPTVFVAGNHDFYRGAPTMARARWDGEAAGSHVRVLDNTTVRLFGVRFIGTPLWSNLMACRLEDRPRVADAVARGITDFRAIKNAHGGAWCLADMLEEHQRAYAFLAQELGVAPVRSAPDLPNLSSDLTTRLSAAAQLFGRVFDAADNALVPRADPVRPPRAFPKPTGIDRPLEDPPIVVTHWGPHLKSTHPMFVNSDVSPYFVNHHPELVTAAALWIHGHTHTMCDYVADDAPEDVEDVRALLEASRADWLASGGKIGPMGQAPLFDPLPVRAAADRGRVISHPHGYANEYVPGLGDGNNRYTPLVLRLLPDGRTVRLDGR